MSNRPMRAVLCAALTCGAWAVAAPAFAALGGTPTPPPPGATSAGPVAVMHAASGAASATVTASYSVTETTLASGTVVREYVSAGTVFGIAWNGPRMPDLATLLGTYFTQFDSSRAALRAANPGRGPLDLELPGLVVRSSGHMGAFSGQAYLPQSLPAGVSAADIR